MTGHPADGHWYTLDTLTFMDFNWFNDADRTAGASMKIVEALTHSCEVVKIVEALTHSCEVVEVTYYATGDYEDRWVDVRGNVRDIAFWRPLKPIPA